MDRAAALRKVQACLRLSKSANPAEAAAAMRHAMALMRQFGLDDIDVATAEIKTADAKTRSRGAVPPRSIVALICVVERAFGCAAVVQRMQGFCGQGETTVQFLGPGAKAEIAAYAFAVLRRALEADKGRHTKRIRKKANKEARGEAFAQSWVAGVHHLFPLDALSAAERSALDVATRRLHPNLGAPQDGREVGKNGKALDRDSEAGWLAGRQAKVNPGLGTSGQRQLEQL